MVGESVHFEKSVVFSSYTAFVMVHKELNSSQTGTVESLVIHTVKGQSRAR